MAQLVITLRDVLIFGRTAKRHFNPTPSSGNDYLRSLGFEGELERGFSDLSWTRNLISIGPHQVLCLPARYIKRR
jgi:hypothetical protein